jgi:hypothetical protein
VGRDQVGDDEVRVQDPGQRHPAAGEFLDHERVGEQRLAEPAVLLADREPEDAQLFQRVHEPVRVGVGVLKLRCDRDDLRVNEVANGTQDVPLDLGEPIGIGETSHALIVRAPQPSRTRARP